MDYLSIPKKFLPIGLLLLLIPALISLVLPELIRPLYNWLYPMLSYEALLTLWLISTLLLLHNLLSRTTSNSYKTPSKRELKKRKENNKQQQESIILNLTEAEKKLLYTFLKRDKKDMFLDSQNGEANSLVSSGVLRDAPGRGFGERQYFVNSWAWEYLQKHKKDFLRFC